MPILGDKWIDDGVVASLAVARDVNLQNMKAIALACDNGAAFPTSPAPVKGQWFLLTVTDRDVLYMYSGTAWVAMFSLGAVTIYVRTTGNDTTGVGTSALPYLTIQKAIDNIPAVFSGSVIVDIGAGTFAAASLPPKMPNGNFFITFQGVTTVATTGTFTAFSNGALGTAPGTGGTQATLTGTYTANAFDGAIIKITSGPTGTPINRVVESNTTTVIALCGTPLSGSTAAGGFDVYPLTTIMSGTLTLPVWPHATIINDIKFTTAAIGISIRGRGLIARCQFTGLAGPYAGSNLFTATTVSDCSMLPTGAAATGVVSEIGANISVIRSLINGVGGSGTIVGLSSLSFANAVARDGTVIKNCTWGMSAVGAGVISTLGTIFIKSCTIGRRAAVGSRIINGSVIMDSSNTLNEQGVINTTVTNADLAATTLLSAPTPGFYQININAVVTTALTGAAQETLTLAWVGPNGATSQQLNLPAADGSDVAMARSIYVASGDVSLTGSGGVTGGTFVVSGRILEM